MAMREFKKSNESITLVEDTDIKNIGLGTYPPLSYNCLNIDLTGAKNGFIETISAISNNETENCPPGTENKILGTKIQYVRSTVHATIVIFEIYPLAGRIWINTFNAAWKGWKSIVPQ